jgi:hypothetical protein
MKAEEILDKHISKMLNRLPDSYNELSEIKEQPEYQCTIDAMNEFYNQALEDVHELSKSKFIAGESGYIRKEDIEIMKKS